MPGAGVIVLLIGSYILGSIPFGLWLVKKIKGIDIRMMGSGNVGSTNVSRAAGPTLGRIAFCLDVMKGFIPPFVADQLMRQTSLWIVIAGILAIIGHNYSLFLKFQGGKGIATSAGTLLGVSPLVLCVELSIFLAGYLATSIISVGSVIAAVTLPFVMFGFYHWDKPRLCFSILAACLAVYRHRANIQRLVAGTEPKADLFGLRKMEAPQSVPPTHPSSNSEKAFPDDDSK